MKSLNETIENIKPQNKESVKRAWQRLDNLAKPAGSLGELENIAAKMAGITGEIFNSISKKNIIVMCADNGVCVEGVSSCPTDITVIQSNNIAKGVTGVGVLAEHNGAELTVVDVGINAKMDNPGIIDKKVMFGTKNMMKEPAMTRDEAVRAVEIGIEAVDELVKKGYNLFGTGEMGIGNTTSSSAVLSVLSGLDVETVTGKGAGLTQEQYENKIKVIKTAIEVNIPDKSDPIDVLSKVGGLDIAGMCGCFLGAAQNRVPIVIDGFISSAAALCAYRLNPAVKDYMFTSHLSAEPGAAYAAKEMGLEPILNLKMRLGEGSGCPLAFNVIEASLYMMEHMATFGEAAIESDFIIDIRK